MSLKKFAGLLLAVLALGMPLHGSAQESPRKFAVIADTGYAPAYEQPDEDETVPTTLGEYLAMETEDWLKRNPDLTNFVPTPWVFESVLGGYLNASGMYPVARGAQRICARAGCNFATMLGDNLYPDGATLGADGISDARRFADLIDGPYGSFGKGIPNFTIYAMMGNHDWYTSREGVDAQLRYLQQHPNFTIPNLFYRAVPAGMEGEVEIFVVDTQMLLASSPVPKPKLDEQGRELRSGKLEDFPAYMRPRDAAEANMVAWLQNAIESSTARWKLVFGHHALWSGGGSKYEKARVLREKLLPILCRHADAYFSGDDHVLEAYTDDCRTVPGSRSEPLPLFVVGAGAKYRSLHPGFMAQQLANNPQLKNLWSRGSVWGFGHTTLHNDNLRFDFFSVSTDMSEQPIHEISLDFPRRSGR